MKRLAVAVLLLGLATAARADTDHLGSLHLGQKLAKAKPIATELYGCKGTLTARIKKKKVVAIRFDADPEGNCGSEAEDPDAIRERLRTALSTELHAKPVTGPQGDDLWEGTKTSVIVTMQSIGPGEDAPEIQLVAATTEPRICWSSDGFAAFFAEFKAAVAAGKPAALARFFRFPFADADYRSDKDFIAHPDRLLTPDTKAAIAAETSPWCSLADQAYWILIPEPHGLLTAQRTAGTWHFTELRPQPQD
jgi:hypothetical protein